MAQIIQLKKRVSGSPGAPATLKTAEFAWNQVDGVLYAGFGDDGSGNATSIVAFAGPGATVMLNGAQTIAGVKTFSSSPVIPDAANANQPVSKGQFDTALAGKSNTGHAHAIADVTGLQAALDAKAALASPALTGAPTAPTAANGTNTTQIATTQFVRATRLDQFAAPTADVSINSRKLTNLADPVSAQDAATKAYVDAAVDGLEWKQSVRVATTANITLSGTQTIDGVAVVAGDRVLVKNQTTPSQNGIYIVATGAWTRATDADANAEVTAGLSVFVSEGAGHGNTTWTLTTDDAITIGTTALTFSQTGGGNSGESNTASNQGAGVGVFDNKVGVDLQFRSLVSLFSPLTIALDAPNKEIDLNLNLHASLANLSGALGISSTWAGQTAITTLGTITTGVWNGSIISLARGGNGADLSGASDGTIFKKSGAGLVAATAGSDYLNSNSVIDGGTF